MPTRRNYFTGTRWPSSRKEKRIKIPGVDKRPYRFQVRTLIRKEFIRKDPWWFVVHRRGPARANVGLNPLEERAVPHSLVKGTLPERILYKALVDFMHFVPDVDFLMQSSLDGGHQVSGGIVADFLFPYLMIVINPLGPTHDQYIRIRKDNEQNMSLELMGYQVYMVDEDIIYNEYTLEDFLRTTFGWAHGGGAGDSYEVAPSPSISLTDYDLAAQGIESLGDVV